MTYIDLHCDTLTKGRGVLTDGERHVSIEKLQSAGALAQCFAIYTDGQNAGEQFDLALTRYRQALNDHGDQLLPVFCYGDLLTARNAGKVGAVLTVENLGFLAGDLDRIPRLKEEGVKIASLVWNYANSFAYPNLVRKGGVPDFSLRERRGLTDLGKRAVEALCANRILVDISHLSDGGAEDVLALSSLPVVATHSDSFAVHPVSRNLTDGQIRAVADSGGVIGVNFCRDFLGGENAFERTLLHVRRFIDIGGEDCIAFGSDFDGIPTVTSLPDCTAMPRLIEYLTERLGDKITQELAYSNVLRLFKEVW